VLRNRGAGCKKAEKQRKKKKMYLIERERERKRRKEDTEMVLWREETCQREKANDR
jgi:hypothetical protein